MNNKRNAQQRSLTSFFQPSQKKPAIIEIRQDPLAEAEQQQEEEAFEQSLTPDTGSVSLTSNDSSSITDNKENELIEPPPSLPSVNTDNDATKPVPKINRRTNNIIYQLHQQSTYGTRMIENRDLSWTAPSWLPLRPARATAMAFDAPGVLLAVAATHPTGASSIRVYDWDMLEAADLHYRRRLASSSFELTPVIDLALSKAVSFLQWNPFQQDVLAVGIRNTGAVLLYDMGVVAEWDDRRGTVPAVELKTGVPAPIDFFVRFIDDGKHILAAANHLISCWDLDPTNSRAPTTRRWTLDLRRRVTSLVPLNHSNLLAVGTANGVVAVVDLHQLSKQPFSRESAPTVLKEFNTLRELQTPSPQHMEIRGLCADPVGPPGWMQLRWTTSCGWHLSSRLDLNRMRMEQAHIDYATPRMKCRKADGALLPERPNSWSMPMNQRVLVGQSNHALFWENVPAVTQILPGHDPRVEGDDVCRYAQLDKKRVLFWRNRYAKKVQRIPLSKSKGNPVCFAVHPQLEWVVVGTEKDQLYLLNSKTKITA